MNLDWLRTLIRGSSARSSQPTVFHITHVKSGSQWVRGVLAHAARWRTAAALPGMKQFFEEPLKPGAVYPTLYVPRARFEQTLWPKLDLDPQTYRPSRSDGADVWNWYHFQVRREPVIKFVVIRDLRDALVSLYFSLKFSHEIVSENVAAGRDSLSQVSEEDGLLFLIEKRLQASASIQHSWLPVWQSGEARLFRYEDMLVDPPAEFAKIVEYCQIEVNPRRLQRIVEHSLFAKRSGRKTGEEDVSSHYRKGVAGDWKNHFTDRVRSAFKQKFGQILIETGYEKGLDW